jgi:hypothetical protein
MNNPTDINRLLKSIKISDNNDEVGYFNSKVNGIL